MNYYVVKDRRFKGGTSRKGYKQLALYNPKETAPLYKIPKDIMEHYRKNVEGLGYASVRGLSEEQCLVLSGLCKGMPKLVRLAVNRWGDPYCYRIDQ